MPIEIKNKYRHMKQKDELNEYTGNSRKRPKVGTKFGQYEVIGDDIRTQGRKSFYHVKCTVCGEEGYVRSDQLIRGEANLCKNCSNKIKYEKAKGMGVIDSLGYSSDGKHKGCGDISLTIISTIRNKAKSRNIEWSEKLTADYLWNLFLKQDKKCALTGLDIHFRSGNNIHTPINTPNSNLDYSQITASLDRIDSTNGYVPGNVQWVHKNINIMKNSFSKDYFIKMCGLVYLKSYQQSDSPINSDGSIVVEENDHEDNHYNRKKNQTQRRKRTYKKSSKKNNSSSNNY